MIEVMFSTTLSLENVVKLDLSAMIQRQIKESSGKQPEPSDKPEKNKKKQVTLNPHLGHNTGVNTNRLKCVFSRTS